MMSMHPEVAKMAAQAMLAQLPDANPPAQSEAANQTTEPVVVPITQQSQQAQEAARSLAIEPSTPVEPLPSQQQLQDENNAREEQLEKDLRAQDEAEASGANELAPPPGLGQPMQADPNKPQVPTTPEQLAAESANNKSTALDETAQNFDDQRRHKIETGKTEAAIARDNQENTVALAHDLQYRHDHLEKVQAEVAQQQEQRINNYNQVNTEMMNMAVAQPKDLYGAAGVNRILGSIAVFLGGAGMNGNHANHALDQITQMANHNVQQQRQRYEMLSKVGEGQRTLYGMLNAKLSNAYTVDAVLGNMTREVYKANLAAIGNKYSDQTTRNAVQAQIDKINEQQAAITQGVVQNAHAEATQAIQLHDQEQGAQAQVYAAQLKAQGSHRNSVMPVAGFVGGVPKAEHPRISKMVGGARILVDGINHMENIFKEGMKAHKTKEQIAAEVRQYFVGNALLFKGARDFLETGTRIEAGEQTIINAFKTDDYEAMFNILFGKDPFALKAKLEASRAAVVAATYQNVKAVAPRSAALDSKDPLFGPYNPRSYKQDPQQYFTRTYSEYSGTQKGRDLLRNSKAYTGGY